MQVSMLLYNNWLLFKMLHLTCHLKCKNFFSHRFPNYRINNLLVEELDFMDQQATNIMTDKKCLNFIQVV